MSGVKGSYMNRILEQKRIDTLYHFTRTENLENIFQYGIIPREVLDRRRIKSSYNDEFRYDDCLDAVCTSIEFPNYKMFYKLRQENPETKSQGLFHQIQKEVTFYGLPHGADA